MEFDEDPEFAKEVIRVAQKIYNRFNGEERMKQLFFPLDIIEKEVDGSVLGFLEKKGLIIQSREKKLLTAEDYYKLTYEKIDEPYRLYDGVIGIKLPDKKKFIKYFLNLKKSLKVSDGLNSTVKYKFPYKLPENLKWSDIIMRFVDGNTLEIYINGSEQSYKANMKEMGFENSKTLRGDTQWCFLKLLSENDGEKSLEQVPKDKVESLKQIKLKTSKRLREYFSIKEDPFFDARKEKLYKLKIKFSAASKNIIINEPDDEYGIQENIDENMTLMPDKSNFW